MPKFNTANPSNVNGNPLEDPEDFMFRMVRETMCGGGGLSFDLLREKGCDVQLIVSYDTIDDLVRAVIDDLIERMNIIWEPVCAEAREYLASGTGNRDQSVQKLERLIYRHTYQVMHPKNRSYVLLCAQESLIPEEHRERVASALRENFTDTLTGMIMAVSEIKNQTNAALLAGQVIGNINFYLLQPELVKCIFRSATGLDPKYSEIEDYMNNMLLRSIWHNTSINKLF